MNVNYNIFFGNFYLQAIAELAIMMGLKKPQVIEVVGENKADELSAMFNMIMDEKKKTLGKLTNPNLPQPPFLFPSFSISHPFLL